MHPTSSNHQIYQCSSECSDHSRSSQSHKRQLQLEEHGSSAKQRGGHHRRRAPVVQPCMESENENMLAEYEQRQYTSDCCNSSREGDTCSCSEGSCLYAEAGEPAPRQMTAKNT